MIIIISLFIDSGIYMLSILMRKVEVFRQQSTPDISNTFISYILDGLPINIYISTSVIANYCYLNVNFLGPENLL